MWCNLPNHIRIFDSASVGKDSTNVVVNLKNELTQFFEDSHCQYPVAGIPTLTAARQDPRSYPKTTRKDGEARPHWSGSFHIRPTAPDPFPAWGWDRRRHVTPRKGRPELTAEASDPPIGVRDLLSHPDPPYRVGVRSRHVSRKHGRGLVRESSARGTRSPTAFNEDG